jgi:hypothetical protein
MKQAGACLLFAFSYIRMEWGGIERQMDGYEWMDKNGENGFGRIEWMSSQ